MPTRDIVRKTTVKDSFRVEQIRGMFDLADKEIVHKWNVSIPIENLDWQIGLIVGASGSGKTTIASELLEDAYIHESFEWEKGAAVIDCFPEDCSIRDITKALNSVGFSSPPHWLKPFAHLSNGQKFRVELARCLLLGKKTVIFDEFTSVVDRDVAKAGCAAISKTIRRRKEPLFIAVSCHYDIIDWLQPDWVFDVSANRFEKRCLQRRPEIKLDVFETSVKNWPLFREHHYLSHSHNAGSRCYVATIGDKPVAWYSVIHFPHPKVKNMKRGHRLVVLPDWQGIGVGIALDEFVADMITKEGFRLVDTTSHPALIHYKTKSPKWKRLRIGRVPKMGKTSSIGAMNKSSSRARITASFEYIKKKIVNGVSGSA